MNTYATLDEARAAAKAKGLECSGAVAEIEHAERGRCYIGIACSYRVFAAALKARPMPEIARLIGGHEVLTDEERAAMAREYEREHPQRCDRCDVEVDRNTAYHQEEWARLGPSRVRVRAYYCKGCEATLKAIGAGEYSAMEERATEVPSYEPETKPD